MKGWFKNERQCFLNFVHTFLNTCLRSKVFSLKAIILRLSLAVAAFQGLRFSWGPLKYKLGNPYCGNKMCCLWPSAQLVEIWTTYVLVIVPQLQYLLPRINNILDQPIEWGYRMETSICFQFRWIFIDNFWQLTENRLKIKIKPSLLEGCSFFDELYFSDMWMRP